MVKTVTVVPTDGGIESNGDFAGVAIVTDLREQHFTLTQCFNNRLEQLAVFGLRIHGGQGFRYFASPGICRRCNNRLTALVMIYGQRKHEQRPRSPCTSMPKTVRWLTMAPLITPQCKQRTSPNRIAESKQNCRDLLGHPGTISSPRFKTRL